VHADPVAREAATHHHRAGEGGEHIVVTASRTYRPVKEAPREDPRPSGLLSPSPHPPSNGGAGGPLTHRASVIQAMSLV